MSGAARGARYALGVDLGTTHCALAYADLGGCAGAGATLSVLPLPQVVAPGEIAPRPLLPSFLYLPHPAELAEGELGLPWGAPAGFTVGELARTLGAHSPERLVSSAKSWLCHPGVDRRAPILPHDAPAQEVAKLSPLDASTRYLEHLRQAWDHAHPRAPFAEQSVTLTVPASFDPAARALTAEAARRAGYARLTLLEEPQAALYGWIQQAGDAFRAQVRPGDVILVVDVGGGTTDLSLIAVREVAGAFELARVAVGDHIVLGGDNMDLTLAQALRIKLEGKGARLDPWQLRSLTHACRGAKEALMSDAALDVVPIVVPSRGSKLIGGSLRTELTRAEATRVLLDGFFPEVPASARPAARRRAALTELGLPYAQEPAVTRHLAAFLSRQAGALGEPTGDFLRPTALLFNGGVFRSRLLVERVVRVLGAWLDAEGAAPPRVLEGADLDRGCARGAAYYGSVREMGGLRIRGGTARSFYVGVEAAVPAVPGMEPPLTALCVAPFGLEEGTGAGSPAQEFGLVVGEPVRFRFFGSAVRREDEVGASLERWDEDELQELGALEATMPAEGRPTGEVVPVRLRASVTEVGTLRLEAVPRGGGAAWKVEFDVRGGA